MYMYNWLLFPSWNFEGSNHQCSSRKDIGNTLTSFTVIVFGVSPASFHFKMIAYAPLIVRHATYRLKTHWIAPDNFEITVRQWRIYAGFLKGGVLQLSAGRDATPAPALKKSLSRGGGGGGGGGPTPFFVLKKSCLIFPDKYPGTWPTSLTSKRTKRNKWGGGGGIIIINVIFPDPKGGCLNPPNAPPLRTRLLSRDKHHVIFITLPSSDDRTKRQIEHTRV